MYCATTHNVDWATFGNKIFPVGTVLTFYDTSDHSDFLGLTWARFAAGRMVVGYNSSDSDFATIGNTGGEKTHTLTIAEMPSHNHNVSNGVQYSNYIMTPHGSWNDGGQAVNGIGGGDWHWQKGVPPQGGGGAHNNMPPYITAALWRRTA